MNADRILLLARALATATGCLPELLAERRGGGVAVTLDEFEREVARAYDAVGMRVVFERAVASTPLAEVEPALVEPAPPAPAES